MLSLENFGTIYVNKIMHDLRYKFYSLLVKWTGNVHCFGSWNCCVFICNKPQPYKIDVFMSFPRCWLWLLLHLGALPLLMLIYWFRWQDSRNATDLWTEVKLKLFEVSEEYWSWINKNKQFKAHHLIQQRINEKMPKLFNNIPAMYCKLQSLTIFATVIINGHQIQLADNSCWTIFK